MNKFVKVNRRFENCEIFGIIVKEHKNFDNDNYTFFTIRVLETNSNVISVNELMGVYKTDVITITDKNTINKLNKAVTFI